MKNSGYNVRLIFIFSCSLLYGEIGKDFTLHLNFNDLWLIKLRKISNNILNKEKIYIRINF